VPRIFNRLNDNVNAAVAQATQGITDEEKLQFIKKVVYEKIKMSLGGKVRLLITGSAPINPMVQEQMQRIMECPMIEGYGQT
jgi:long-chain acyl-CoA synthetase